MNYGNELLNSEWLLDPGSSGFTQLGHSLFIRDIAGPLDMDIVLLRVVSPVVTQMNDATSQIIIDDMAARTTEAREYLATIAPDLMGRGIHVQTRVRDGDPVTEILAAAREVSADLIAMSTHGRSGFTRLLFGSVAEAVLRQGEYPVFVMRVTAGAHRVTAGAHTEAGREVLKAVSSGS